MPIQITCPACRQTLRVPDELIGQMVKCPSCLSEFAASLEPQTVQLDPGIRPAELGPPVPTVEFTYATAGSSRTTSATWR